MKNIPWTWTAVLAVLCLFVMTSSTELCATPLLVPGSESETMTRSMVSDELIRERVEKLSLPFEATYDKRVRKYVQRYTVYGRNETEDILGRSRVYFPIFDHYLVSYGLPSELKYLPMIESGLIPTSVSHMGAAGLWQLMPIVATHYRMTVNGQIDERFDPYKSTEIAVRLLRDLYKEFGDWELVLAGYNAGAGTVRKAIRESGSRDFSQVQYYLPAETRNYVPAYVAAAYVVNYYNQHGLEPSPPTTALQNQRLTIIKEQISLNDIAAVTGLPTRIIYQLNPAYRHGYIPASRNGRHLVLPTEAMAVVRRELLDNPQVVLANQTDNLEDFFQTTYAVAPGDNLVRIAEKFNVSVAKIKYWNQLSSERVVVNQELVLYLSSEFLLNKT